jgi:hypothetical protein
VDRYLPTVRLETRTPAEAFTRSLVCSHAAQTTYRARWPKPAFATRSPGCAASRHRRPSQGAETHSHGSDTLETQSPIEQPRWSSAEAQAPPSRSRSPVHNCGPASRRINPCLPRHSVGHQIRRPPLEQTLLHRGAYRTLALETANSHVSPQESVTGCRSNRARTPSSLPTPTEADARRQDRISRPDSTTRTSYRGGFVKRPARPRRANPTRRADAGQATTSRTASANTRQSQRNQTEVRSIVVRRSGHGRSHHITQLLCPRRHQGEDAHTNSSLRRPRPAPR